MKISSLADYFKYCLDKENYIECPEKTFDWVLGVSNTENPTDQYDYMCKSIAEKLPISGFYNDGAVQLDIVSFIEANYSRLYEFAKKNWDKDFVDVNEFDDFAYGWISEIDAMTSGSYPISMQKEIISLFNSCRTPGLEDFSVEWKMLQGDASLVGKSMQLREWINLGKEKGFYGQDAAMSLSTRTPEAAVKALSKSFKASFMPVNKLTSEIIFDTKNVAKEAKEAARGASGKSAGRDKEER